MAFLPEEKKRRRNKAQRTISMIAFRGSSNAGTISLLLIVANVFLLNICFFKAVDYLRHDNFLLEKAFQD